MNSVDLHNYCNMQQSKLLAFESIVKNTVKQIAGLIADSDKIDEQIATYNEAIQLCLLCLEEQSKVKNYIEKLATNFLNTVIREVKLSEGSIDAPELKFVLEPVVKDGITVGLKPLVGEGDDFENYTECGVGVSNLISCAIRLVFVLLNPELSQVIIGDEMLVNLHPQVWGHVLRFIEDLQANTPFQLILVTHAGVEFPNTLRVYKKGTISYVEVVN